jgi:hypothetical protein
VRNKRGAMRRVALTAQTVRGRLRNMKRCFCIACGKVRNSNRNAPQRLKPPSIRPFCGTTKVVPFHKAFSRRHRSRLLKFVTGLVLVFAPAAVAGAIEPSSAAVAEFNSYVARVEARLAKQHRSAMTFLAPEDTSRLRPGDPVVDELTPAGGEELPGALLHDWRGAAFVSGATAADFERVMENFSAYPHYYAPQVVRAPVLAAQGGHFQVLMRVRQQHVITVVMDTTYDVTFARLDAEHGYSISRSTRIDEIASPGTRSEHALSSRDNHGFLWRMNTYWSFEQQDGGLFIQVESVSLTRSIPTGLGWAVGPFIESIPRDSLDFTLQATCRALRK